MLQKAQGRGRVGKPISSSRVKKQRAKEAQQEEGHQEESKKDASAPAAALSIGSSRGLDYREVLLKKGDKHGEQKKRMKGGVPLLLPRRRGLPECSSRASTSSSTAGHPVQPVRGVGVGSTVTSTGRCRGRAALLGCACACAIAGSLRFTSVLSSSSPGPALADTDSWEYKHALSYRSNVYLQDEARNGGRADIWGPSPPWLIQKQRDVTPLTMYSCGWAQVDFMRNILPEYQHVVDLIPHTDPRYYQTLNATVYDVLIFGKHGPCPQPALEWMHGTPTHPQPSFAGKIIYINAEAVNGTNLKHNVHVPHKYDKDVRNWQTYELGPLPNSSRSLQIFSATFLLANEFQNQRDHIFYGGQTRLTDGTLIKPRPKGTMERFLVYCASHCVPQRELAFYHFSRHVGPPVEYAGRCHGGPKTTNASPANTTAGGGGNWGSNAQLYRHYRFCLVMENTHQEGYITEKILLAFLGGCIPIYSGTEEVLEVFNPRAFIYYHAYGNQDAAEGEEGVDQAALERVKYLEYNRTAYEEVMNEPILAHGSETLERYFSFRDDIGGGKLKHKIRDLLGIPRSL